MDQINGAVRKIVENITGKGAIKEYEAYKNWPSICGERIASVTEAQTIISGILYVKVKNSVWRQELSMLKPEIINKYQKHFSSTIVKDVVFR